MSIVPSSFIRRSARVLARLNPAMTMLPITSRSTSDWVVMTLLDRRACDQAWPEDEMESSSGDATDPRESHIPVSLLPATCEDQHAQSFTKRLIREKSPVEPANMTSMRRGHSTTSTNHQLLANLVRVIPHHLPCPTRPTR